MEGRSGEPVGAAMGRLQGAPDGVPDLADALTELANLMVATPTMDEFLNDLARLATAVITPPASCGITLCPRRTCP